MTLSAKSTLTPEEYLALEREAEFRSEYYNGEIFAMAGGSREHSIIIFNIGGEIYNQLGDSCEGHTSDMRVKVSPTGLYTYPDVVVVCGDARYEDDHGDTLLNPTLIIEVLSPSTQDYDREEKFDHYQTIESLTDYLLVSQDKPRVEHFTRQENNRWLLETIKGREGVVELPSIGCRLALAHIYRRIDIAPGESLHENTG
jgi:Uma2 family endonuclease